LRVPLVVRPRAPGVTPPDQRLVGLDLARERFRQRCGHRRPEAAQDEPGRLLVADAEHLGQGERAEAAAA
jgi:hypothetical protein